MCVCVCVCVNKADVNPATLPFCPSGLQQVNVDLAVRHTGAHSATQSTTGATRVGDGPLHGGRVGKKGPSTPVPPLRLSARDTSITLRVFVDDLYVECYYQVGIIKGTFRYIVWGNVGARGISFL